MHGHTSHQPLFGCLVGCQPSYRTLTGGTGWPGSSWYGTLAKDAGTLQCLCPESLPPPPHFACGWCARSSLGQLTEQFVSPAPAIIQPFIPILHFPRPDPSSSVITCLHLLPLLFVLSRAFSLAAGKLLCHPSDTVFCAYPCPCPFLLPFLLPLLPQPYLPFFFSPFLPASSQHHGSGLRHHIPHHPPRITNLTCCLSSSPATLIKMATTSMDYEAANGDRYEGSSLSLCLFAARARRRVFRPPAPHPPFSTIWQFADRSIFRRGPPL